MPAGSPRSADAPAARAASPRAQRIAADYLKRILTARVYDVARETALEPCLLYTSRCV